MTSEKSNKENAATAILSLESKNSFEVCLVCLDLKAWIGYGLRLGNYFLRCLT